MSSPQTSEYPIASYIVTPFFCETHSRKGKKEQIFNLLYINPITINIFSVVGLLGHFGFTSATQIALGAPIRAPVSGKDVGCDLESLR